MRYKNSLYQKLLKTNKYNGPFQKINVPVRRTDRQEIVKTKVKNNIKNPEIRRLKVHRNIVTIRKSEGRRTLQKLTLLEVLRSKDIAILLTYRKSGG